MYTVGQLAELSGVTVKTLHHYHRIGLVIPKQTSEAGYRLYGQEELERLQEVLFYRELDVSLLDIKKAMRGDRSRAGTLELQKKLLMEKQRKLARILQTLERSLSSVTGGRSMSGKEIFVGLNAKEWNSALEEQNSHLEREYGHKLEVKSESQATEMNSRATEASQFLNEMAAKLKSGVPYSDRTVVEQVERHVQFLDRARKTTAEDYVKTTEFLASDPFHSKMFEGIQVGLSAYLVASAYAYRQGR